MLPGVFLVAALVFMRVGFPHQHWQRPVVRASGVAHRQEKQAEKGNRDRFAIHDGLSLRKASPFVQADRQSDRQSGANSL